MKTKATARTKPLLLEDPGDAPKWNDADTVEANAQRLFEYQWKFYAFNGIYSADPAYRATMKWFVRLALENNQSLPEPARIWLLYVLGHIRSERLPTEHRGRPFDRSSHVTKMHELARWWAAREKSHPKEKALDRLGSAADDLRWPEATVKRLRYQEGFKNWLLIARISLSK